MNTTLFQIKSLIDFGEFVTKGKIYNIIKIQPNGMYVIEPDDVGLMCGIEKEFTEPVETDADKIEKYTNLVNCITKMQEEWDENGYDYPPDIKLQRIEQAFLSTLKVYKNQIKKI